MKGFYRIGVMAALATVSAVAMSQGAGGPPSPEAQAKSAIETRQGLFKVIANQNGPVGAMTRGQREVDTALVTQRMERIKVLSEMIKHHVKEEEQRDGMFAQAKRNGADLEALGERLAVRKKELTASFRKSGVPAPETRVMKGGKLNQADLAEA